MHLGGFKGSLKDDKNKRLVDMPYRQSTYSSSRQLNKGEEVYLEFVSAVVAFSSKQSAWLRGTAWGDSFWTSTDPS